jgi:4'-phosphopantetheinyl transferase
MRALVEHAAQRTGAGAYEPFGRACLNLQRGEVHLWYALTEQCCTPSRLSYYRTLLDESESQRFDRLAIDHVRHEYLLTRALCRVSLSHYVDVTPSAWRFVANEYGRPRIADPELSASLRFNLSNSRGLVACLIARDADVGVDVEEITPDNKLEIAQTHFSMAELRSMASLPSGQQQRRFFELWTLKEGYIKARGMGLSLALDQFSFDIVPGKSIRINLEKVDSESAAAWQFELFRPGDRHSMAVAIHKGIGPDWRIRTMQTIPGCAGTRAQGTMLTKSEFVAER